jgi:ethanolamine ammonia-lyase small subunit
VQARSLARDRREYLLRPDLGRMLDPECVADLKQAKHVEGLLTIVIADGLSSIAAERNALPLLEEMHQRRRGWTLDTVVIAMQARVALGDAIGELRGAEAVLMLIGERPGLSSPDSMGAYLTYAPRIGRTDAERNCVSNIRVGGLSAGVAAEKLARLLQGARRLKASGVVLKDTSDEEDVISPGQKSLK